MSEKHGIRLPGVLLDEIHSKEDSGEYGDRKFGKGLKKRKVSRRDARKEKRLLKKQKQNHSKQKNADSEANDIQPQSILSAHGKSKVMKSDAAKSKGPKKSVSFDESLNKVKEINPAYKKLDFFNEGEDEEVSDESFSDLDESDFSDLEAPNQPQTAAEVIEALKRKKLGLEPINKKLPKQSKKSFASKPKTAKQIMEELNNTSDRGAVQKSDDMSDFSGDSEDYSDLEGPNQPQTSAEVFEALKKAKLGKSDFSKTRKSEPPKTKPKTAKEIMEELNGQSSGNVKNVQEDVSNELSDFFEDSEGISDLEGPDQPQTATEVFDALRKAKLNKEERKSSTKNRSGPSKPKTAKEIMAELNGKGGAAEEEDDDFSGFSEDGDDMSDLEGPGQPQTASEVFEALKKAKLGKGAASKKDGEMKNTRKEKQKAEKKYVKPSFLNEDMQRDEDDMKYYAKKLGLKNMKLNKADEDDLVGGLFEGLDFMDEYAVSEGEDDVQSSEEEPVEESRPKENPYVAPIQSDQNSGPRKYIPPALRRMQLSADEQEKLKIQRAIKGQLNKLSEVNILVIANEINSLYLENARRLVNELLTKTVLESIYLQSRLLDSFVVLHAALVAAIYRLQGPDFLVFFIQSLIENYETFYQKNVEDKQKESSNLLSLLTFCYTLQVVNCNLIYDIIRLLVSDLNEYNSELLLRLIKNTGSQLRSDDPLALKEIVSLVYDNTKGKKLSPRTQFLIESIEDLKNNKLRRNEASENNFQLIVKMKKFLGSVNNNKIHDPLTVTLDDIHNIDKRGKWWVTGSAWKGKSTNDDGSASLATSKNDDNDDKFILENVNAEAINDILDTSEPNWVELAKAHRMNNDIRRAVFISIMSSDDYFDAFTKLDKLQLKRNQQREIPGILLHCQQIEPAFNKFYGLLAGKLCSEHIFRKTFQFSLWNFIKELNNEDDDEGSDDEDSAFRSRIKNTVDNESESEDLKLQKLINSAKIFGFLMGIGSLQLNLFRVVNFLTINEDTRLFLEILFITFFEEVIKKSQSEEEKQKTDKNKSASFDDHILEERFGKIADPILLKGMQLFLRKVVRNSTFIKKKFLKKTRWAIDHVSEGRNVEGNDGISD